MLDKAKLDSLKKIEAQRHSKSLRIETVWDMVRSIHASPTTREWVTLESRPLCPSVRYLEHPQPGFEANICILLCAPSSENSEMLNPPWAYLAWCWPSMTLSAMVDLRRLEGLPKSLLPQEMICSRPYADSVDEALKANEKLPSLPKPLEDLYRSIFGNLGALVPHEGKPKGHHPLARRKKTPPSQEAAVSFEKNNQAASGNNNIQGSSIPSMFEHARSLILSTGQEPLLHEWKQILGRFNRPFFSVAVVGEFSRGKSTFINRLLGSEILPVGDLPTTAMVARIIHGSEGAIWWMGISGKKKKLPLAAESWDHLGCDDQGNDPEGILQIEFPHEWLRKTSIQIIDSPGAGDLIGKRSELVSEVIAASDATLVTISATMAMSLTERSFIEQRVLSKKVPCVAIVITRLDQIKEPDRLPVIRHVKDTLEEWAPGVPIWTSFGYPLVPEEAPIDAAAPEQILKKLESWATDPQLLLKRTSQTLLQLKELMTVVRDFTQTRLDAATLSDEQRKASLQNAEQKLSRARMDWEDLRLELEKRELACADWLTNGILKAKIDIFERLQYALRHSPNAKSWWQEDLPFLLRREVLGVARSVEDALQRKFLEDATWLDTKAKQTLSCRIDIGKPESVFETGDMKISPLRDDIPDTEKLRTKSRVLYGVATAGAYLLLAPIGLAGLGVAMGIGGALLTEKAMKGNLDRQREMIDTPLENAIASVLEASSQAARQRLKSIYGSMLSEVTQQEGLWATSQRDAIAQAGSASLKDIERWTTELTAIDDFLGFLPVVNKE